MVTRRNVLIGTSAILSAGLSSIARGQATELVIKVTLPTDRTRTGFLSLERADGTSIISSLPALGKSDNARATAEGNVDRLPTLPFGDTPQGTYSVPRVIDTGPGTNYSAQSYGPSAAIVLRPASGEAQVAAANGRTGLLIHSGAPGANGRLRATHGCIRLSNGDMDQLLRAIADAGSNPVFNRCEVVRVSVVVGSPADEGPGADENDPPPGIDDLLDPRPIAPIP